MAAVALKRCRSLVKVLAGASALGAGFAAKQAMELRSQWHGLRCQASACLGPSEGKEQREQSGPRAGGRGKVFSVDRDEA
eukprot:s1237_g20.t1